VLIGNLVASVVLFIGTLPFWVRRLHFSWEPTLLKAMMAFAFANFFANISFYVLNFSDRYLLNRLGSLGDVGLYQVAFQLATPVYFAGYAFRMAWPQWHYSFLHDPPKHKQRVARGYTYFTLISASLIVVVGVFLPITIRVFLRRPEFWSVGSVVMVLLAARAFFNSYHLFLVGVNVTKKNRGLPILVLVAAVFSICMNFVMIPRYGVMGAALTNALSFFLLAVAMRQLSQHYYPIPHEWSRVARLTLATVATLTVAWALGRAVGLSVYLPIDELAVRQLVVAPTVLVFPLLLWATRVFDTGERKALRRMGSRALHPRAGRAASAAPEAPVGEPGTLQGELARGRASEEDLAAEEERLEEAWEVGLPRDGGQTV
jgi:O-antigen/teichoic acid export membrane protein